MSFNAKRDAAVADHAIADRALLCTASGCPNRWSLNFGKPLCRFHAFAEPHAWPQVTQEQLDAETDRALAGQVPKVQATVKHWSLAEKRELLQGLRALFASAPASSGRAWATLLRRREQAGEPLTAAQRDMWRAGERAGAPLLSDIHPIERDDERERLRSYQERVREYAEQRGIEL